MLMGEYTHSLDTKGRVIMPSKFRDELGSEFVITKGIDSCLYAYPLDEWKVIEEGLKSLNQTSADARKFMRFFFAGAAQLEVDKQGRVLIPSVLREYAGLEKDLILVGVLSKVEIWSKDKYMDATADSNMDEIAEHLSTLGLSI